MRSCISCYPPASSNMAFVAGENIEVLLVDFPAMVHDPVIILKDQTERYTKIRHP